MHPSPTRGARARLAVAVAVAAALALSACSSSDSGSGDSSTSSSAGVATTVAAGLDEGQAQLVVENYADGAHASYVASLQSANVMAGDIVAFLSAPSEQTLQVARDAWLSARPDYGLTEAFRFYGGPIDDEEDGPEGRINAWPLDEAYIDYVEGNPEAGMVNDPVGTPAITAEGLAAANEEGGETNISTGWHAIEFLLWGQDLAETGPGARPATDYTTAPNAERRASYLAVTTNLLLDDLSSLVAAWDPGVPGNYRSEFLALPVDESLTMIITGIGELSRGELAGERMTVAYEERDQENEHSCFSDNTLADIEANQQGIINVWSGSYPGGMIGIGLDALVATVDEPLAVKTTEDMALAAAEILKIPAPFDQHLTTTAADTSPGRVAIVATTELLSDQADDIVASAAALGLTIEVS
jgi:putative iron-regulated protein